MGWLGLGLGNPLCLLKFSQKSGVCVCVSGFVALSCADMAEFIFEEWTVFKVSLFLELFQCWA